MDDITTRTIIIAVNVFVTVAIVSLVIVMFFQMQDIYGVVASTDTSIYNKFDDVYSMYNGKVENGIGLLNTLKKYEDYKKQDIIIKYPKREEVLDDIKILNIREVEFLKDLMKNQKSYEGLNFKYEDRYNVVVTENDNGQAIIEYQRMNNK